MTGLTELVPVTITAAFTGGTVLGLVNTVRVPLAKRLGATPGRISLLAGALQFSLVPTMLLGGILIDQAGVEWVLIGGSLLTAVAVAGLAMCQSYRSLLFMVVVAGTSIAAVTTSSNVLMPAAFVRERPAASANLGNIFFVLGLLLAPLLVEVFIGRFGFRRTLGAVALLCLTPAVIAALTPASVFQGPAPSHVEDVLGTPLLWLALICFFLYGPLESMVGTWSNTYLSEMGYNERRSAWMLTGFWLCFLGSRLLTGFLLTRIKHSELVEVWLLIVPALAVAVGLGNLAGAGNRGSAAWGVMLVGFALGPIFPTLVGLVYRHFEGSPGTALGAAFSASGLGSMVLLPLIGVYAQRTTVQKALHIPAVIALGLTLAAMVLALSK